VTEHIICSVIENDFILLHLQAYIKK